MFECGIFLVLKLKKKPTIGVQMMTGQQSGLNTMYSLIFTQVYRLCSAIVRSRDMMEESLFEGLHTLTHTLCHHLQYITICCPIFTHKNRKKKKTYTNVHEPSQRRYSVHHSSLNFPSFICRLTPHHFSHHAAGRHVTVDVGAWR